MHATQLIVPIAALLIVMILALAFGRRKGGKAPLFKARPLLTANELEFLHRLESAVPEYRFHAQVAMGALLEPAMARKGNGSNYMRVRGMFSQKIVDYVAQRRDTGQIVAIIELDDRTHDKDKDASRDAMLHQAGYRTVRWQSKNRPGAAEILAALVEPPSLLKPAAGASVREELFTKP